MYLEDYGVMSLLQRSYDIKSFFVSNIQILCSCTWKPLCRALIFMQIIIICRVNMMLITCDLVLNYILVSLRRSHDIYL